MNTLLKISIPKEMKFSDLKLVRDPDGMVSFEKSVIERICEINGIDTDIFFNAPEDNVSQLIVIWYKKHIASGGKPDPVAEAARAGVMGNHPNRSSNNPCRNPTPEEIIQARESAGLNMSQAAAIIYCNRAAWLRWESGERRMHPAFWELFRMKINEKMLTMSTNHL